MGHGAVHRVGEEGRGRRSRKKGVIVANAPNKDCRWDVRARGFWSVSLRCLHYTHGVQGRNDAPTPEISLMDQECANEGNHPNPLHF